MAESRERRLRIAWLVPDDRGGGVVSVAEACCRQAAKAGHDPTLLLALAPNGHAAEFGGFRLADLGAEPPYRDIPERLIAWLAKKPQDVLVLNGCEEADAAIPYIPAGTRVVYAVHDTADRYFSAAIRDEQALDAIVAVSETVATRFRHRLADPGRLRVAHNGTVLPLAIDTVLQARRADDLVFLGADKPVKGAYDVIELWRVLASKGFRGRLHWFGETSDAFGQRVSALPASDRIVLHGRAPRRAIFETAASAKVVLMLSRVEPFGMATVECMGMGCLLVAWDIDTGTKEIVRDGEGRFAPLGDFATLADGVLAALGQHAARFASTTVRVRADFSEEAMWARYRTIFDAIVARPPARRPHAGQTPPLFRPPLRLYQLLPAAMRRTIRTAIGRAPRLGYMLRDFRGR
jgi:glycosyltransferase involved in cell wall biosynthesis